MLSVMTATFPLYSTVTACSGLIEDIVPVVLEPLIRGRCDVRAFVQGPDLGM